MGIIIGTLANILSFSSLILFSIGFGIFLLGIFKAISHNKNS